MSTGINYLQLSRLFERITTKVELKYYVEVQGCETYTATFGVLF